MDYEAEYKGLVNELTRHFIVGGRMVRMCGYYSIGNVPAIKLSESPYVYNALVAAGARQGVDDEGRRTLFAVGDDDFLPGIPNG